MLSRHSFLRLAAVSLAAALTSLAFAADDQPVVKEPAAAASTDDRPADDRRPTLWIIGDSTVKLGAPIGKGWGEVISPLFDPAKIRVVNRAIGGRSTRTFITDGRWDKIIAEMRPGDFVIMQFGHNDSSPINEKPPVDKMTRARGTIRDNSDATVDIINVLTGKPEIVHSYGRYLRFFIDTAKLKGAAASIVCSPIPHKTWTADGHIERVDQTWGLWARQAADQAGGLFLDLNEIIARGYEKIGPEAVAPMFADERTHTTAAGADFNARAVVAGLRGLPGAPLDFALSPLGASVPPFAP